MSGAAVSGAPALDQSMMRRALRLAWRGRYGASPNPMVGCVLARGDRVVGEGFHVRAGEPHAEAQALARAGARARGATAYVTLEPCAHHGRTPPCCEALIAAGVARVVTAHGDPDERVAGRGHARLRSAGIEVTTGVLRDDAATLNLGYLINRRLARPAVTLKWAMSLDGKIATRTADSKWLSAERARRFALDLRERHDAVVVGSETVLADDPALTRRLSRARGPHLRVVLDRRLRTPAGARLFAAGGEGSAVVIYTEETEPGRVHALTARGATVVRLQPVTPASVLEDLWSRRVHRVLVEGGGEVLGAFLDQRLYDQVVAIAAPVLVGGRAARGPVLGEGVAALGDAPRLEGAKVRRLGEDVAISGLRPGCLQELSLGLDG